MMQKEIGAFIHYLKEVKKASNNTEMSYKRDLGKVSDYLSGCGITEINRVKYEDLASYVQYLNDNHFSAATVSRNIASIKALFHFLNKEGMVKEDISKALKAPKIEKRIPEIMSPEETIRLLEQPSGNSAKELRDKAMLELLYATGIRSLFPSLHII